MRRRRVEGRRSHIVLRQCGQLIGQIGRESKDWHTFMEAAAGDAKAMSAIGDADEIDFWAIEGDSYHTPRETESQELSREWDARRQRFRNLGYRDGITAGTNSSVQEGFNAGFKEAVIPAFNWGAVRGASSAFSGLPTSLKELLLKDQNSRNRLEGLHSKISSISSAEAMGVYNNDMFSKKKASTLDSFQGNTSIEDRSKPSGPIQSEETNLFQPNHSPDGCCGGGACGSSRACTTSGGSDAVPAGNVPISVPSSTNSTELETLSNKPISKEALELVLAVSTCSADGMDLEDSSTTQLGSLALGVADQSESLSRLQQYQRKVKAEFGLCDVNVSVLSRT